MELSDIHPIAVVAGIAGGIIGFVVIKGMSGANISGVEYNVGLIWRILIPIVCAVGGFFIVQKMAE